MHYLRVNGTTKTHYSQRLYRRCPTTDKIDTTCLYWSEYLLCTNDVAFLHLKFPYPLLTMHSKAKLFAIVLAFLSGICCTAQAIDLSGKLTCTLPSKVAVALFPTSQNNHEYYCLPTNLRVSYKETSTPEFLFMAWKNEGSTQIDGGILHWLLTWGLIKNEEKFVRDFLIAKVDSNAVLKGVLTFTAPSKYQFLGKNTELIALLQRSLSSGGIIPSEPSGKSASSFRFSAEDARTIEKLIHTPEKADGVWIEMPLFFPDGQEMCRLRLPLKSIFQAGAKCPTCLILPK